jgi:hypothetical protein
MLNCCGSCCRCGCFGVFVVVAFVFLLLRTMLRISLLLHVYACRFTCCVGVPLCPDDEFECWDGSFVSRNRLDGCSFHECPGDTNLPVATFPCFCHRQRSTFPSNNNNNNDNENNNTNNINIFLLV